MPKIRVGLLGVGAWALYGHLPVLQRLPNYEVTAVASRSRDRAAELARQHGVKHALGSAQELCQHPEVDLVAVLNQAPQHYAAARLAVQHGKSVYCEWPLTPRLEDTRQLELEAREAGVRTLVGLQRRFAPSVRYLRQLLADVGTIRSVRMHVSEPTFGPTRPDQLGFTVPTENFSSALSIYGGHFLDTLLQVIGPIQDLHAITLNQFPEVTLRESGTVVRTQAIDQAMLLGRLEHGAPVSFHVEGGKRSGYGVQLDITGTEGDLRLRNDHSFHSPHDHRIEGGAPLRELPIPAEYRTLPCDDLDASTADLAHLYQAFSEGRPTPGFADALALHELLAGL